uniref:integration host factor, actinobacterial type n=1 Tax=Kitasatospora indigofera TaxID=67307 RepID=UPI002F90DFF4
MPLPSLTPEQRQAALVKAMQVRIERGRLLADLKQGKLTLTEILDRTDDTAARITITRLLRSLPGIGTTTAQAIIDELGISPTRRIRGLGPHQRHALLTHLTPEPEHP